LVYQNRNIPRVALIVNGVSTKGVINGLNRSGWQIREL
jgi:hypothetical protein